MTRPASCTCPTPTTCSRWTPTAPCSGSTACVWSTTWSRPGNERVAIAQTPYSAFRGARTRLERMAGATTDIQHIVHQGLTYYNATFWVGANAVIRKAALDDIVDNRARRRPRRVPLHPGPHGDRGHRVQHRPHRRRLEPVQLPRAAQLARRRRTSGRWSSSAGAGPTAASSSSQVHAVPQGQQTCGPPVRWSESALRLNYMGSIAWASFSLVLLLLYPFDGELLSPLVFFAALPYFLAMASDFHRLGYKRSDMLRSYGFNLILLPVNLAGVIESLQQAASKSKTPLRARPRSRTGRRPRDLHRGDLPHPRTVRLHARSGPSPTTGPTASSPSSTRR